MYQDMYARMLVEMRTYAAALDNVIKALIGLQALAPHKGRPSKEVINYRIQAAAHEEENNFSIVDPGFKPSRKKSKFSVATRKRMAAAQKKRGKDFKKVSRKVLTMKTKRKAAA